MREVNLLESYPRIKRDLAARESAITLQRGVARRFGPEYFDGDRTQGYGGYRYDGRWVPVAERIASFYGLTSAHRVLDVGCAKGFLLNDLERAVPGISVSGLDISEYALANAIPSQRGHLVRGNARDLPFPDKSFDLVLSINTIHNLPRAECVRAVAEIERVSRRYAYIQVDSWLNEA